MSTRASKQFPELRAVGQKDLAIDPSRIGTAVALRSASPAGGPAARPIGGGAKRAMDIIVASTALVLLLPLMLMVVLLIKLTMGGPIFFVQQRVGYGGRRFPCYKFRTMVVDAEAALSRYLARDPQAAEEWRQTRKLRRDPRITSLGYLLRKSSIDELPQLINVLRGEMSCVGPRPIVVEELERYGSSVNEYLKARPGMTGMWQVSGRSGLSYADRVALDCKYIRTWSVWGDLVILSKTISVVARFDGAA